jgi:hypothetical protein
MLEAAWVGGSDSFQYHRKWSRVAVTVSEAAGHRATIESALKKAGAYGAGLEEPLADFQEKAATDAVSSTRVVFRRGFHGQRISGANCIY